MVNWRPRMVKGPSALDLFDLTQKKTSTPHEEDPFVSGELTNIFDLLQVGVNWFLEPNLHTAWSCASVLLSFSTTSFHLFFDLPFFEPSTTKFFIFTGAFHHPFFSRAQIIAIFALTKIPLSSNACHTTICLITNDIS